MIRNLSVSIGFWALQFLSLASAQAAEQRPANLITLKNTLDRPIEVELRQENLEPKVVKPMIGVRSEITLEPVEKNKIIIPPNNAATIELRASGNSQKGEYIVYVVADKHVTLFAYEMKGPSERTIESQKIPGICTLGRPGESDRELKITAGRLTPLACKPLTAKIS